MEEKNDPTALALAKSAKSNALRSGVEEQNQAMAPSAENEDDDFAEEELSDTMKSDYGDRGTILGVLITDLLGMGGESKAEAARRAMEAVLADDAAMDRLRAELRREDESRRKQAEPEEDDLEMKRSDYEAWVAKEYRRWWIAVYSANFGSFDDTSEFPIKHPPSVL